MRLRICPKRSRSEPRSRLSRLRRFHAFRPVRGLEYEPFVALGGHFGDALVEVCHYSAHDHAALRS